MSLETLLNQTVTIATKGDQNQYGKFTYDGGVDYPARFEQVNKTITTVQHEREPIDGTVFVSLSCIVGVGDKLTYDSVEYRVMRISKNVVGGGSLHHQELLVQLWST